MDFRSSPSCSLYLDAPQGGEGLLTRPQGYDVSFYQQANWQVHQVSISVSPVQGPGRRKGHVEVWIHGVRPHDLLSVPESI